MICVVDDGSLVSVEVILNIYVGCVLGYIIELVSVVGDVLNVKIYGTCTICSFG